MPVNPTNPTMRELICPVTKTRLHHRHPWQGDMRSGMACKACHRTWTWRGDALVPTYSEDKTTNG